MEATSTTPDDVTTSLFARATLSRIATLSRGGNWVVSVIATIAIAALLGIDETPLGIHPGMIAVVTFGEGPAAADVATRAFLGLLCRAGVVTVFYPLALLVLIRSAREALSRRRMLTVVLGSVPISACLLVGYTLSFMPLTTTWWMLALGAVGVFAVREITKDRLSISPHVALYLRVRLAALIAHWAIRVVLDAAFAGSADINAFRFESGIGYVILLLHAAVVASADVELASRLEAPTRDKDLSEVFA